MVSFQFILTTVLWGCPHLTDNGMTATINKLGSFLLLRHCSEHVALMNWITPVILPNKTKSTVHTAILQKAPMIGNGPGSLAPEPVLLTIEPPAFLIHSENIGTQWDKGISPGSHS